MLTSLTLRRCIFGNVARTARWRVLSVKGQLLEIYSNNSPQKLLSPLDNERSLVEDLIRKVHKLIKTSSKFILEAALDGSAESRCMRIYRINGKRRDRGGGARALA